MSQIVPTKVPARVYLRNALADVGLPPNQRSGQGAGAGVGTTYLYKATFQVSTQSLSAGTLGASEGFETGNWTAVINDGALDIDGSNQLDVTGQTTPAIDDLMLYGATAVTRTFGMMFKISIATGSNRYFRIGFSDTAAAMWSKYPQGYHGSAGININNLYQNWREDQDKARDIVVVLGGWNSSGTPYQDGDIKSNFTYGARVYVRDVTLNSVYTLAIADARYNTATLYPSITFWNSAVANITGIYLPDPSSLAASNSLMQPEFLDTFTGTNGDDLVSTHTVDVGSSWTAVGSAAASIQSNTCQWSVAGEFTQTYTANGKLEFKFTMPASGTTSFGIRFRRSDANNFWEIRVTPASATTADVELYEYNTGVYTQRGVTAGASMAQSTSYKLTIGFQDGNNMTCDLDDATTKLILYQTANTFNQSATGFSIFDNGTSNASFEHVALFDSQNSSVYDAEFDAIT